MHTSIYTTVFFAIILNIQQDVNDTSRHYDRSDPVALRLVDDSSEKMQESRDAAHSPHRDQGEDVDNHQTEGTSQEPAIDKSRRPIHLKEHLPSAIHSVTSLG